VKALEILKRFVNRCESAYGLNNVMVASLSEVKDAIEELEALQAKYKQVLEDYFILTSNQRIVND